MGGIDTLLRFVVQQIALQSKLGATPDQVVQAISQYHHTNDDRQNDRTLPSTAITSNPTADRSYFEQVWAWLIQDPDISLGLQPDDRVTALGLNEVEAFNAEADKKRSAGWDESDVHQLRLYASEEQIWRALTGHGVDQKKVSALEFSLLATIATFREEGVVQPDLPGLTGQDKRSIPGRTTRLAEKGYIIKKTIHTPGKITSRLILAHFAGGMEGDIAAEPANRESWAWQKFGKWISILKEALKRVKEAGEEGVAWLELRHELLINRDRSRASKAIIDAIQRFRYLGCVVITRTSGAAALTDDAPTRIKDITYVRDVTEDDWARFWTLEKELTRHYGRRKSLTLDENSSSEHENIQRVETREPRPKPGQADPRILTGTVNDTANAEKSPNDLSMDNTLDKAIIVGGTVSPAWTPDRPLVNLTFSVVNNARTAGITTANAVTQVTGKFFNRPVSTLLVDLSNSQWDRRLYASQHLQLLRDSTQVERYTAFSYFTFTHFRKLVDEGEKAWQWIGRPDPEPSADGQFEFSELPSKLFLEGDAVTAGQCLAAALNTGRTREPNARKVTDRVAPDDSAPQLRRQPAARNRKYKNSYTQEELNKMKPSDRKAAYNTITNGRRYHYKQVEAKVMARLTKGFSIDEAGSMAMREILAKIPKGENAAKETQLDVLPEVLAKLRRETFPPSAAAHTVIYPGPYHKKLLMTIHKANNPFWFGRGKPPVSREKEVAKRQKPGSKPRPLPRSKPIKSSIGYIASSAAHGIAAYRQPGLPTTQAGSSPLSKGRTPRAAIRTLYGRKKYFPSCAAHSNFTYHFLATEPPRPGKKAKQSMATSRSSKDMTASGVIAAEQVQNPEQFSSANDLIAQLVHAAGEDSTGNLTNAIDQDLLPPQPTVSRSGRQIKQSSKALGFATASLLNRTETRTFSELEELPAERKKSVGALTYGEQYEWLSSYDTPGLHIGPSCSLKKATKGRGPKCLLAVFRLPRLRDPTIIASERPRNFAASVIAAAQREAAKVKQSAQDSVSHTKPAVGIQNNSEQAAATTSPTRQVPKRKLSQLEEHAELVVAKRRFDPSNREGFSAEISDPSLPSHRRASPLDERYGSQLENGVTQNEHGIIAVNYNAASSQTPHVNTEKPQEDSTAMGIDRIVAAGTGQRSQPTLAETLVSPALHGSVSGTASAMTPVSDRSARRPNLKKKPPPIVSGVSRHGGSLTAERKKIVIDIMDKNGGFFSVGHELWYPFATQWAKKYAPNRPDTRTVKNVVKQLVEESKIKEYIFNFLDRHGVLRHKKIIMFPTISKDTPDIVALKKEVIKHYPHVYVPPGTDFDPTFRHDPKLVAEAKERRQREIARGKTVKEVHRPVQDRSSRLLEQARLQAQRRLQIRANKLAEKQQAELKEADDEMGIPTFTIPGYQHNIPQMHKGSQTALHRGQYDLFMQPNKRKLHLRDMQNDRGRNSTATNEPIYLPLPKYGPTGATRRQREGAVDTINLMDEATRSGIEVSYDRNWPPRRELEIAPRPAPRFARILPKPPQPVASANQTAINPLKYISDQRLRNDPPPIPVSFEHMDTKQRFHQVSGTFGTFLEFPGWFVPQNIDDILNHKWPGKKSDKAVSSVSRDAKFARLVEKVAEWEMADLGSTRMASHGWINLALESQVVAPPHRNIRVPRPRAVQNKEAPTRKRRRPTADSEREPRALERILKLKRPGGKINLLHPDAPEAKRQKTGKSRLRTVDPSIDRKILLAIIMAKVIYRSGDPRYIDWDAVRRLLSNEITLDFIRKRYNQMRTPWKSWIAKAKTDLEEEFLLAYQAGHLPHIDFTNSESTQWDKVMAWVEGQSLAEPGRKSRKQKVPGDIVDHAFDLSNSRNELEKLFQIRQYSTAGKADAFEIRYKGIRGQSRRNWLHEHASFVPAYYQPTRRRTTFVPTQVVARSWVRATALTAPERYNGFQARQKLETIPVHYLDEAERELFAQKALRVHTKDMRPGDRPIDISQNFVANLRMNLGIFHHQDAVGYKQQLDSNFRKALVVNFHQTAHDGHMIALLNMYSQGMISLTAQGIQSQAMGHLRRNYKTRALDKEVLLFAVEVRPTARYVEGLFLTTLPRKASAPIQRSDKGHDVTPLPIWIDIHGNYEDLTWRSALNVLVVLCLARPGITAEELSSYVYPTLEAWELRVLMRWMVDAGLAEWVGPNNEGVKLTGTWWSWTGLPFQGSSLE